MQKSYVAKSPINFVQFSFRVNAGDILVHDAIQQKLTVYRNGGIVKTMKQSALGMIAFIKDGMCEEIVEAKPAKPVPQPIDPAETIKMLKNVPKLKPDLPKEMPKKREEKKPEPKAPRVLPKLEDETI